MKTHDIGILLSSMLTLPVQAQHRLSGKVDTENMALPLVNVAVLNSSDSTFVSGTASDSCGTYGNQTTGKIVDINQQPIEGATIVMQLPDSTYLGAAISAADGTFVLESEPENYQLIVQHLLYQTRLVEGQAHDAGIIVLESKDYNLDEVVIEGERPSGTCIPHAELELLPVLRYECQCSVQYWQLAFLAGECYCPE